MESNGQLKARIVELEADLEVLRSKLAKQEANFQQMGRLTTLGIAAAGLPHEIRNPLSIMMGTAKQLHVVVKDLGITNELVEKFFDRIHRMGMRINRLLYCLTSLSRNCMDDDFVMTDVCEVIDMAVDLCADRCRLREIELRRDYKGSLLKIECKGAEISQIIVNLVMNAADAIDKDPTKWIRVSVQDTGTEVEISVTDSGPGIPENLREKLFIPFFTTKGVGSGTGLGLPLAKLYATGHRGDLVIDSSSPNTHFVLKLPKTVTSAG